LNCNVFTGLKIDEYKARRPGRLGDLRRVGDRRAHVRDPALGFGDGNRAEIGIIRQRLDQFDGLVLQSDGPRQRHQRAVRR
jgi:hypothetical protein